MGRRRQCLAAAAPIVGGSAGMGWLASRARGRLPGAGRPRENKINTNDGGAGKVKRAPRRVLPDAAASALWLSPGADPWSAKLLGSRRRAGLLATNAAEVVARAFRRRPTAELDPPAVRSDMPSHLRGSDMPPHLRASLRACAAAVPLGFSAGLCLFCPSGTAREGAMAADDQALFFSTAL